MARTCPRNISDRQRGPWKILDTSLPPEDFGKAGGAEAERGLQALGIRAYGFESLSPKPLGSVLTCALRRVGEWTTHSLRSSWHVLPHYPP